MLTHVFPRRNTKFAPETTGSRTSARKRNDKPWQDALHFDKDKFVAVRELYQNLQSESSAANEDAATGEEEVDPDSDEHACGLVIDNSSELPPPAIIIEDSANIIADNETQSFRSRMQYEGIANISRTPEAPLVPSFIHEPLLRVNCFLAAILSAIVNVEGSVKTGSSTV